MPSKPRIAVVLSGCGVEDGSEIHEAVLTLLALDRQGAEAQCFAPDIPQKDVVNHLTHQEAGESRNVLAESARIARGKVRDLATFRAADFDGIMLPGGFGAAKNLSGFAIDGADCAVERGTEQALRAMAEAGKPIGALCIAPAVVARVIRGVTVTIGNDSGTASAIEEMGGHHKNAVQGEVVVDTAHRVATTPCYMLDATIAQIAASADAVVAAVLEMIGKR